MIIKLEEINESIISKISKEIFIYPTDTIYGIGCNAEDEKLVEEIRMIKKRDKKPFSIIAPSVDYIFKNFEASKKDVEMYLPGAYTLILKKKNDMFLNYVSDSDYIGVRIPNHPMTKFLQRTGKPIITTSVNLTGEKPANSINEINKKIFEKVDLTIDGGMLSGKPSTLIKDGKIIER